MRDRASLIYRLTMAPFPMEQRHKAGSGIPGLDQILAGGFPRNRVFLVEGSPGTGKTTLALQFLLEGVRQGEKGLYVTLSETMGELEDVAGSHGWSLDGIELYELEALEQRLHPEEEYTVFHPEEVELSDTTKKIYQAVERLNPRRVVFDSLSEMRLLARDALRFRRQILALKQFFAGRDCTVVLLDDQTSQGKDLQLQSICHGVVLLEKLISDFGAPRRRLSVTKLRGVCFRDGLHDMVITTGGLVTYPRLVAASSRTTFAPSSLKSGVPELDSLLGGGLSRGASTLFLGPAGSGKSSLATMFACHAAETGAHSAFFLFEESINTFLERSSGLGMDIGTHIENGLITLQQVDPGELSPGEFAAQVCRCVQDNQAKIVVIDSLNGYLNSMPNDRLLLLQMHELLTFLGQKQIVTMMTLAQHGMLGQMHSPVDLSYLADVVVLLRFFEFGGELRQAISVVKKRNGTHERTIREMKLTSRGPVLSEVLREFKGVLTGVPSFDGAVKPLIQSEQP